VTVIADTNENIEHADQYEHGAENAAEAGFAEEEDLRNRNEYEHQAHANVHACCVQASFGSI
jgi:hypothetical protein